MAYRPCTLPGGASKISVSTLQTETNDGEDGSIDTYHGLEGGWGLSARKPWTLDAAKRTRREAHAEEDCGQTCTRHVPAP